VSLSRAKLVLLVLPMVASILAQAGCGSSRREAPLAGPVDVSDPQVKLGQQVFSYHCYQCHPGGRAGVGPALNNKPLPQAAIRTQVRAGVGAMPGFNEQIISDEQLRALGQYVAALRRAGKT
jgi:mono/diheme cytochrome c family protein